jgi:hypothetical protein
MGDFIYIWVSGIAVLVSLEVYFGTQALRNLAPGIERKPVGRISIA